MENNKPFACPVSHCGMRFVNEDHLTVHKQKHELSLSLTPNTAFKTSFYVDQTPTPTRFLNALESELFNDLPNDNPFDATFRRANSSAQPTGEISISEPAILSSTSNTEPLNTPSITLPAEDEVRPKIQTTRAISLKQPIPRIEVNSKAVNDAAVSSQMGILLPGNSVHYNQVHQKYGKSIDLVTSSTELPLSPKQVQNLEPSSRDTVVQTRVITSVGNLAKIPATCVPTAVVTRVSSSDVLTVSSSVNQASVAATKSASQSVITGSTQSINQSVPAPPIIQFIVQLPNGQSMPVTLPMAVAQPIAPPVSISSIPSNKSAPQSLAKKKLKEVLKAQKESTNFNNIPSEESNLSSQSASNPAATLFLSNFCLAPNDSESPPSSPISSGRPGSTGRRRQALDDPEDRRKKSLERNRAAAIRCRQKRKQWILSLESKANDMAKINAQLQNEVSMLRNEVAQLKTMLLAHKNCPVTQQMKASGFPEEIYRPLQYNSVPEQTLECHGSELHKEDKERMIFSETINHVIDGDSLSETGSRHNFTVQSNQNEDSVPVVEIMDMETSSSQSGNISDSEVSTRES